MYGLISTAKESIAESGCTLHKALQQVSGRCHRVRGIRRYRRDEPNRGLLPTGKYVCHRPPICPCG